MHSLPLPHDSVARQVSLEPVLFVGGGRALLMQVAHPSVAAGVAAFSDYRRDPWNRLLRTTDTMYKLAFGTPEQSRRTRRSLAARHRRVEGTDESGRQYSATDSDLVVWVWATLVDTSLLVYQRVFGRLDPLSLERFYAEQRPVAVACGAPLDALPPDLASFRQYVDDVVDSDLVVTDAARDVCDAALAIPIVSPLRQALGPVNVAVTTDLLPASLRDAYRLTWNSSTARRSERFFALLRGARYIPAPVRRAPATAQLRSDRAFRLPRLGGAAPGARILEKTRGQSAGAADANARARSRAASRSDESAAPTNT